ncbi:hypothetical protein QTP88_022611 [Uroleucon formosanum]
MERHNQQSNSEYHKLSTMRADDFIKIEENIKILSRQLTLIRICETHWIERHESITRFKELYLSIYHALKQLESNYNIETSKAAFQLSSAISISNFVTSLHSNLDESFKNIFSVCEKAMLEGDIMSIIFPWTIGRQTCQDNMPADSPEQYYKRKIFLPLLDNFQLEDRVFKHHCVMSILQSLIPKYIIQNTSTTYLNKLKECALFYKPLLANFDMFYTEIKIWQTQWQNVFDDNRPKCSVTTLSQMSYDFYPNIKTSEELKNVTEIVVKCSSYLFLLLTTICVELYESGDQFFHGPSARSDHLQLSYPLTKFGTQNRAFKHYIAYEWLEYSISKDSIFCFACRNFSTGSSGNFEDSFLVGFRNWKKLSVCSGTKGGNKSKLNKLDAHAKSNLHLTCMVKWSAYQKTKETDSVYSQISSQHSLMVENIRMYMKMLVDIVLFLSCQGIGSRGHDETKDSLNQGNFKELCKLLEKNNEEFGKKINLKTNYTSHIIQDELINICAVVVKEIIVKDIEDVEVFGIMCDEQESLYIHFSHPSKNQKLIEIQTKLGLKYTSMIRLSDTRWNCRYRNIESVKASYKAIIQALEEIENEDDRGVNEAIGKSKNVIQGVMMTFKNSRITEYFSKLWCEIEIFAKDNEISIQTPSEGCKRKRQEPHILKHFDTTTTTSAEQNINNTSKTIEDYFRKTAFFSVFDTILINLEKIFSAESLQMATAVDQFIQLNFEESLFFVDHYKDLMNVSKEVLQSEIEVAKNCILQSTDKKNITLNHVKKVLTKQTFPNLYKLFQVALTIPISSSTCERSFSAMRQIKTWLRTSMLQERFNNTSILYIEKEISKSIDTETIINIFAQNNRYIQLN